MNTSRLTKVIKHSSAGFNSSSKYFYDYMDNQIFAFAIALVDT